MKIKLLFFLFLSLSSFKQFGQTPILTENAVISILNCGTGNEAYSLYGHTGIRIKDSKNNIDVVFNYGAFDFDTPNFMLKFVKGDLQYFVTTNSFRDFEYSYRYEKRSIYEQVLNLTPNQKQQLFQQLNESLYSDERYYTYKFIDRNCTTMVIDKVNNVLGTTAIDTKKPVQITYREILYPYLENHFFEKLGINMIFGTKVDVPAERLFLPLEFIKSLEIAKTNKQLLAKPVNVIYEAPKNVFKPSIFNSIYTVISILGLIVLARKKGLTMAYFSLLGLLGLFFSLVGFYSFHQEVLWNYNVLLFNPLFLMLTYFYWKENRIGILRTGQIILAFLLIYLAYMLNKIHLTIMLPFIVANFLIVSRMVLKAKNKTTVL